MTKDCFRGEVTASRLAGVAASFGAVAALAGLVGCAASTEARAPAAPTTAGPTTAGPTTAAPTAAPDPNAPEVNAAGDIPDNQAFVPYSPPGGLFTVSVPEGWARIADGAAVVVFTDRFNSVRVEATPRPAAPDVASARAEEVPAITATTAGFTPGDVTVVQRKAGAAVLITYTASSPVDPVTGKSVATAVERYEFWRGGQELILTLTGPQGADNVDPWRIVSDSFGWLR